MNTLAILIPTYGRSNRLEKVTANLHTHTRTPHTIYFITEIDDIASAKEIERLHEKNISVSSGTYVAAINTGYRSTTEPYLFLGSDDIEVMEDWDSKMLSAFTENIGIVGHTDEWDISKTGKHGSHLMVKREYIEAQSGVVDEANVIYSSKYVHSMCDIETEQTAMMRHAFAMSDAFISHKHWFMKTAEYDETYKRVTLAQDKDFRTYASRRKRFEQYKFEDLFHNIITPVVRCPISIVIPSYNQCSFLKATINSLAEQTYNDYELIIIDDASDNETKNYIQNLDCIKVMNTRQKYVNANWNEGIRMASHRYVVIANNDITFSKDWDVHLLNALQEPDVWVASPYQTDPEYLTPYGQHERSGNIALRGSCFMLDKQMIDVIGYIPNDMLIWFGDWWLVWQTEKYGKKSVFTDKAVIHHYGSKSSNGMQIDRKALFFQILRGDAYAFKLHTGINVDKWLRVIYDNLGLPLPI